MIHFDGDFPVESYSIQQKAAFLLSNAVDEDEYSKVIEEVRKMGIDLETVVNAKPREEN